MNAVGTCNLGVTIVLTRSLSLQLSFANYSTATHNPEGPLDFIYMASIMNDIANVHLCIAL